MLKLEIDQICTWVSADRDASERRYCCLNACNSTKLHWHARMLREAHRDLYAPPERMKRVLASTPAVLRLEVVFIYFFFFNYSASRNDTKWLTNTQRHSQCTLPSLKRWGEYERNYPSRLRQFSRDRRAFECVNCRSRPWPLKRATGENRNKAGEDETSRDLRQCRAKTITCTLWKGSHSISETVKMGNFQIFWKNNFFFFK